MISSPFFVDQQSIVRKIWGKGDTILFIFAGAAAEFALNKAVDWLYFTGRLPADPLGRLFSTVTYARRIVFSPREESYKAIDTMRQIHSAVEVNRGGTIPDWAYRDVLFMLIHYSISSYELLERKLNHAEKEEVFQVFHRMGARMGLKDLPESYSDWLLMRESHLTNNLAVSKYTTDLFRQYRKHLGAVRYWILLESQKLVVPQHVRHLLGFGNFRLFKSVIAVYKLARMIKLDGILKSLILPSAYKRQIQELDIVN